MPAPAAPTIIPVSAVPAPPPPAAEAAPARGIPIAVALSVAFGALVFAGIASVLAIGLWSARQNTLELLARISELTVVRIEDRVRAHLDPVRDGNVQLARMISNGEVDAGNPARLGEAMAAAMAAAPRVRGMAFLYPDQRILRVTRSGAGLRTRLSDWSDDAETAAALERAMAAPEPYWGALFWSREAGSALINYRSPVRHDGAFAGVLYSVVAVTEVSQFLSQPQPGGIAGNRFVLYGANHVLAHPALIAAQPARDADPPLPRIEAVGDAVLAEIWNTGQSRKLAVEFGGGTTGHAIRVAGEMHVFLYRTLYGYGDSPLIVGAYVERAAGLDQPFRRVIAAAAVGLLVLTLAVLAAWLLARRLARPVRGFAELARRIGDYDFANLPRLGHSGFREIDQASDAFNRMAAGLRWFESYVPRGVVRELAESEHAMESREQDVTVLFTDIVGFTGLSQGLEAAEVAKLLNEHYALIAAGVQFERGMLDKYAGDSVMAFWAPPLAPGEDAVRAARAARLIRAGISGENARRRERGLQPVRLRIGLHRGPAVVGNVGAAERISYTVIGDTVNVAQRLEELCDSHPAADADVTILVSGSVAEMLPDSMPKTALGEVAIRGRAGSLKIFRLA